MDTYEKKYEEAQKWIESIYSELSHEQQMEAEAFFPELKESEDEKMMHQLHSWMKEFGGAEEYTEKVYTWLKSLLEKQGESYTKRDVDNAFVEGMAFAKNELEKQGAQKPQRMISAEAKESLLHDKYEGLTDFERTLADICIGWIGQELGWKQYIKDNADVLLKIAIKMFNSVQDAPFEQKPTDNDMVEALRMEYEKGRADVLRCIDPDEMVADFCSQPLSKTRSIASIYRQGIIDIIKRINNNEETSITGTRSINDCGM